MLLNACLDLYTNQRCSQTEHKERLFSTYHTAAVRKNWPFENEFVTYVGTMGYCEANVCSLASCTKSSDLIELHC